MRFPTSRGRVVRAVSVLVPLVFVLVMVCGPEASASPALAAVESLSAVINNITKWLVGMLAALATLFLTVGGVRWLLAGGDPSEVARAKDTLKYAAIGYAVAMLAPVILIVLKGFVGAK